MNAGIARKPWFSLLALLIACWCLGGNWISTGYSKSCPPYRFFDGQRTAFYKDGISLDFDSQELSMTFLDTDGAIPEWRPSRSGINPDRQGNSEAQSVWYPNVWDGISISYQELKAGAGILKSTYEIAPFANPDRIRLAYSVPVRLLDDGSLRFELATGYLHESAPVAWQVIDGVQVSVDVTFKLLSEKIVGFDLGDYASDYPLIIDPAVTWHTFVGGMSTDYADAIAMDSDGSIYMAGYSYTSNWGTAPLRAHSGDYDAVVVKLNSSGSRLWYTFLGSADYDKSYDIEVGPNGNVYVTGQSSGSWGNPITPHSGSSDGFVCKLNPNGNILWNTFWGTSGYEGFSEIAVDGNGNLFLTGDTPGSWGNPIVPHGGGQWDTSIVRFDGNGNRIWNTFIGTSANNMPFDIVTDENGFIYLSGQTGGSWGDPINPFSGAVWDGFLLKMDYDGNPVWNTFIGNTSPSSCDSLFIDPAGGFYLAGFSDETWGAPVRPHTGEQDAFLAKFDGSGNVLWNTFMGPLRMDSNSYISGNTKVILDSDGNLFVGGDCENEWGSPTNPHSGNDDFYIAKLDNSGNLKWHTFFGSSRYDSFVGFAQDPVGNLFVGGSSVAAWGAPLNGFNGSADFVVAKISPEMRIIQGGLNLMSGAEYDFGEKIVNASNSPVTFTIKNIGSDDLVLSGTPKIDKSGPDGSEFTINESSLGESISADDGNSFTITFTPISVDDKQAVISIPSNDSDQNPYTLTLRGTGAAYHISGYVRDSSGAGIGNVTVQFSDGDTVETDASGYYGKSVYSGWTGSATPAKDGYSFNPSVLSFSEVTSDLSEQNITATLKTYLISGYVIDDDNNPLSDVSLAFSNGGGNVSTNSSGYFSWEAPHGWGGSVTPSRTGYTFIPSDYSYSNVTSSQSGQNFSAEANTFPISGYVRDQSSQPLENVLLLFSNNGGNASTDANGFYSHDVLYGWSGTITPEKAGYAFLPESQLYSNVQSAQSGQNFSGLKDSSLISGIVRDISGNPISGVTISFSGDAGSSVTDASGHYAHHVLSGWTGNSTPNKAGFTFTPETLSYTNISVDQSNQNFTGIINTYVISGVVYDGNDNGIADVTIDFRGTDGSVFSAITDQDGFYEQAIDYGWTGTATPTRTGYTFIPSNYSYSNVTSSQSGQNFRADDNTFPISGYVRDQSSQPLENVLLLFSNNGGNASTDANGFYSHDVRYGWSGTITPEKAGYAFLPESQLYSNVQSGQSGQNFSGLKDSSLISGIVRDISGNPISGVTISFGGDAGSSVTDANGHYAHHVPYDWSGATTPNKAGFTFTPEALSYTNISVDQSNQNFTGIINKYVISGVVYDGNDNGIAGVAIDFSGTDGSVFSTITDQDGFYEQAIDHGWTGTVTPRKSGYTFSPLNRDYGDIKSNLIDQHFYSGLSMPDAPQDVTAQAGIDAIKLSWIPGTGAYLRGYNVYRATSESGPYLKLNTKLITGDTYTDSSDVARGVEYYYYLTAVDADGVESVPSNIATAIYGQVKFFIPDASGYTGTQVRVPVNIANADHIQICGLDVYISYDPMVLSALDVDNSALSSGYAWAPNLLSPGVVRVSLASGEGDTLYGEGALFHLLFDVVGGGSNLSTALQFDATQTQLYACGDNQPEPVELDLSDIGIFTVDTDYILGDIDGNGRVDSGDVITALNISVGKLNPSKPQNDAGDISGDGRVRTNDAILILRLAAGLPLDASPLPDQPAKVDISLGRHYADPTSVSVWVPITISDMTNVMGAEIVLNYDPDLILATGVQIQPLTESFDMGLNQSFPGQVRISLSASDLAGSQEGPLSGELVKVQFTLTGDTSGLSPLVLTNARLNDAYGRDFENSSLQVEIAKRDGSLLVSDIDLASAISILRFLSGGNVDPSSLVDFDGNGVIGLNDAIFTLQVVGGIR